MYSKVALKSVVFRGTDFQVTTAKLLLPSTGVPTSPDVFHQRGTKVTLEILNFRLIVLVFVYGVYRRWFR